MSEEHLHEGCSGDCCDCGSDCESHDHDHGQLITLTMDDDTEVTCAVVTIFPANDREYIALLPLDEDGENSDGEVFIYRFEMDANNNPTLDNIEDDDEYEIVADAFDEFLDTQEYDELAEDEE